ncbi:hypothetical protein AMES_2213 [Amycolatopsis mediterranei S699]|uniref:Septum formation-related domain-containing protein n=2 Tax=Amycolatopsis mediterranei TaxID=33910 RepID=A0A0H3D3B0_AMYMU|nr:hypothetical protein [Amycolatopsis mediterranei]ADJ44036.1 conserved hypothetical protein [Amycolatopsis mediterranei U32]AEK40768.1 hypothetical protein RAM_11390 [Amycolatopsis mediterranei S699]AFO75749.1 hypothetical protein AMES_2213 [Amycolatopsis mediterranei S699]AGT82878.1 hypothetical protein B737_2214 [Amycolatopsis mediterranei RB]KDO06533.1 hypothetical protein DV26_33140 [Amycolatopsis mediterranei]
MTAKKTLRVLADYDCWALWVSGPGESGNLDPADPVLGLSPALVRELNRWADDYTATLNRADPRSSGFGSAAAEQAFVARGRRLAEAVRAEVGSDWRVTYHDGELGRDVEVPELFDELMRTELRRRPVSGYAIATLVSGLLGGLLAPVFGAVAISRIRKQRQRGLVLVVCGLVAFTGWMGVLAYRISTGTAWWQQQAGHGRLPEDGAHGLDLAAGECFWAPAASGEADVVRTSCTAQHTGQAFEVIPLGEGPMPDILELYRTTLARCEAGARPVPGVRVQVMTPTSTSWAEGKHRVVCYYHFAAEMTGSVG